VKNEIDQLSRLIVKTFLKANKKFATHEGVFDVAAEAGKETVEPAALLQDLTGILYRDFYAGDVTVSPQIKNADASFTSSLFNASTTRGYFDHGWAVESVGADGQISVRKDGSVVALAHYEYVSHAQPPIIGSLVTRQFIKGTDIIQPQFYYLFADEVFRPLGAVARIYWNIGASSAPSLVHHVTSVLNKYRVPFLFKCLSAPELYGRKDAAVLYMSKRHYHQINNLLPLIYAPIAADMKDGVPGFTKVLAGGLGYADSPASGESFGISRCRVVAKGLLAGVLAQEKTIAQFEHAVNEQFRLADINPEKPYLNNNTQDVIMPLP